MFVVIFCWFITIWCRICSSGLSTPEQFIWFNDNCLCQMNLWLISRIIIEIEPRYGRWKISGLSECTDLWTVWSNANHSKMHDHEILVWSARGGWEVDTPHQTKALKKHQGQSSTNRLNTFTIQFSSLVRPSTVHWCVGFSCCLTTLKKWVNERETVKNQLKGYEVKNPEPRYFTSNPWITGGTLRHILSVVKNQGANYQKPPHICSPGPWFWPLL